MSIKPTQYQLIKENKICPVELSFVSFTKLYNSSASKSIQETEDSFGIQETNHSTNVSLSKEIDKLGNNTTN
jgi:hypothetical protein